MARQFDFPFWMRIIRFLNRYDADVFESQVAKELDITHSHTAKIIMLFYRDGLVEFRAVGRTKFILLTPKGKVLAELVDKLMTNRDVPVKIQRGV